MSRYQIHSSADMKRLTLQLAGHLAAVGQQAVAARGRFRLVLSGGRTPAPLYEMLGREPWRWRIPWPQTDIFWGDERLVPLDDPASNYRLAQNMLQHVQPGGVYPMVAPQANADADQAAAEYEALLRRYHREQGGDGLFDLVLLGMGEDGHTASLFPESPQLAEEQRLVVPVAATGSPAVARLTLTLPALAQAREVVFIIRGRVKQHILAQIQLGSLAYPAARVRARGEMHWYVCCES